MSDFTLSIDEWSRLVYRDAEGNEQVGIEPVRAFPITDPRHGISLVGAESKEIAWVDDLDALPEATRKVLEHSLAQKQFMPILLKVKHISKTAEPNEWEVDTDRGPTRFPLKSDEDVRRLADNRALIIDAHGLRYLIPDLNALDMASRRLLERYL